MMMIVMVMMMMKVTIMMMVIICWDDVVRTSFSVCDDRTADVSLPWEKIFKQSYRPKVS